MAVIIGVTSLLSFSLSLSGLFTLHYAIFEHKKGLFASVLSMKPLPTLSGTLLAHVRDGTQTQTLCKV